MSKSFRGLSCFVCVVDDFVMYNITDYISLVIQFLQHSKVDNIVLSVDKYQFFKSQVTPGGFHLSVIGYNIDPTINEAITNYSIVKLIKSPFFNQPCQLVIYNTNVIATLLVPSTLTEHQK